MKKTGMFDFHTHTFFSDGVLVPTELVRRAVVKGYQAMAITDHVDDSNYDFVIPRLVSICKILSADGKIIVLPGCEITHVPPKRLGRIAAQVRQAGAKIVLVHGETLAEPVEPGTNRAALESDIDILVHPGLITLSEARLAARREIYLEITCRRGHAFSNGHVAATARKAGAKLILDTDSHHPDDLTGREEAERIAKGAGLSDAEVTQLFENAWALVQSKKS